MARELVLHRRGRVLLEQICRGRLIHGPQCWTRSSARRQSFGTSTIFGSTIRPAPDHRCGGGARPLRKAEKGGGALQDTTTSRSSAACAVPRHLFMSAAAAVIWDGGAHCYKMRPQARLRHGVDAGGGAVPAGGRVRLRRLKETCTCHGTGKQDLTGGDCDGGIARGMNRPPFQAPAFRKLGANWDPESG